MNHAQPYLPIFPTTYDAWKATDRTEGTPDEAGVLRCDYCGDVARLFPRPGVRVCSTACPQMPTGPREPVEAGSSVLVSGSEISFVLAGNATFTLLSARTGQRFTYRVRVVEAPWKKDSPAIVHFVHVLTGPDNQNDFEFLGSIFDGKRYAHGKRSRIGPDAPSARAFGWFFERAVRGKIPPVLTVYHMGRCGRCGRPLTDPESIASGLGPICRGR